MKIGNYVKTNKNGVYVEGNIIDKKVIKYFDKDIVLFKIETPHNGYEWVNEIYIELYELK